MIGRKFIRFINKIMNKSKRTIKIIILEMKKHYFLNIVKNIKFIIKNDHIILKVPNTLLNA